jgi:hypothetical protein
VPGIQRLPIDSLDLERRNLIPWSISSAHAVPSATQRHQLTSKAPVFGHVHVVPKQGVNLVGIQKTCRQDKLQIEGFKRGLAAKLTAAGRMAWRRALGE